MSIRLRLTLLYTAVLALTLLAFGTVLYIQTANNQHSDIDRSLNARVQGATPISLLPVPEAADNGDPNRGLRPGTTIRFLSPRIGDPTILVQVTDGNGQNVIAPQNLNGDTLPPPKSLTRHFENVTVNHVPLRMLVWPIPADRPLQGYIPPYTALLARSLVDVNNTLARLRLLLLFGSALSLAVAAGAGWLMARNALVPITRLTSEAHDIGRRQDFKRRVRHTGPDDELGRLAGTFNAMLDGLDAAHDRLHQALEAQRRFVADASHELRTPLTTIRGNVELLLLEADGVTPDQQEALNDVASETERMSRLVNNLLALARADSGLHIPLQPVEVRPVVAEVVQKGRHLSENVDLQLGENVAATIQGDRDYLVQLLLILVDNALKYTPPGGIVAVSSCWGNGDVRITVSDRGPGIAPEDQEHIFDRFYRVDPSRHGEGTGLGLSIARWISRELGGDIELQSALGRGSTFTVVLPAMPAQEQDALVAEPAIAGA